MSYADRIREQLEASSVVVFAGLVNHMIKR